MKKTLSLFMLATLFALPLFAAGQSEAPAAAAAPAGPQKLVIWSHAVHEQVARGTRGGAAIDLVSQFEHEFNAEIEWITLPFTGMQDAILRQVNLPRGEADVVFVVENWANQTLLEQFDSLNDRMRTTPVADAQDIPDGVWGTFRIGTDQKAVPYRSVPQILHYNQAMMEARGMSRPPATIEEVAEYALRMSYTREDGAQVYGLAIKRLEDPIAFIRAFGGEVLTPDFQVRVTEPAAIRAITLLRDLFNQGVIPPDFATIDDVTYSNLYSEGLIGMTLHGNDYFVRFNNPENAAIAGDSWFTYIPASRTTPGEIAPAKIAIWGAGIPRNSPAATKDLAFEFLRFFASPEAQLAMARNGNSPVRSSTYQEPSFAGDVPYAAVGAQVMPVTRPHLPAFEGTQEVIDVFARHAVLAITGRVPVEQAMNEAATAIESVLRREGIR